MFEPWKIFCKNLPLPTIATTCPEEYLAMEWENGVRYEYWEGELVAMAETTLRHNEITINLTNLLKSFGKGKGCKTFTTDVLLSFKEDTFYFLPDVIFNCHPVDIVAEKYIQHPSIIVEVLSESTEIYDRSQNWEQYRKIKSLRHYLLVSQNKYQVEMYSRAHEFDVYYYQCFDGLKSIIPFPDLGFKLAMRDVYEGLALKKETINEDTTGEAS